jgi:predicted secreted hydrolase
VKLDARHVPIVGQGWMDHEWGTGDLPGSRWTFVAIQLDSGEEYCAYQVDRRYENKQGVAHGYRVTATGVEYTSVVTLAKGAVEMPKYGYPLEWVVTLTFASLVTPLILRVSADFAEQRRVPSGESALPFVTLWEGAATVRDATNTVIGRAFLEMGGYE